MMKFMWCSAHAPLNEQLMELNAKFPSGELVYLKDVNPSLQEKLNNTPANRNDLYALAIEIFDFAGKQEIDYLVQPGGSPAFQMSLGCIQANYPGSADVMYAHSERVSIDKHEEDGSVTKTSIFKHVKFIVM